jgi:hypothetical protein
MPSLGINNASKFNKPVFNPKAIESIVHWWQTNVGLQEADGTFPEDTDGIYKWEDQVGGQDVSIGDAGLRPAYNESERALNFNGPNRILQIAELENDITLNPENGFSLFFKIKFSATPNNTDIFVKDGDDGNYFIRAQDATTIRVKSGSAGEAGQYNFTVPTMNTLKYYIIEIEVGRDANLHCYINGTESSTGALEYDEQHFQFDTIKGSQTDSFRTLLVFKDALNLRDKRDLIDWLKYRN